MKPRKLFATTCSVLLIVALLAACGESGARDFKLTIVFDNTTTNPQSLEGWGFAAVVDYGDHRLLFDTGGSGSVLLDNLRLVDVDPTTIEAVILSHQHDDHTGGLMTLLNTGIRPTVYAPASFTDTFKRSVRERTELVEVSDALEILPGVYTTRPIGSIVEEALVVETGDGAVVITGCAHPGLVEIVREAQAVTSSPIAMVIGGFHLGSASESQVSSIIAELRQLGVEKVLPCHCTGEKAIDMFRNEYGENFVEGGVGRTVAFSAK